MLQTITEMSPRTGRTDFYNAVIAALNASAERADQRGGPAYVVILGDGLDRTSIVGTGTAGASESARIAEERNVQAFTLGYGRNLRDGARLLSQLADRANGTYQPDPDAQALADLAAQMQANAAGGIYRVRYTSALEANGTEYTLGVNVEATNLALTAETSFLLPRAWNPTQPVALHLQLDTQAYPEVTLLARPINQLRRTVPQLEPEDVQLMLDGESINIPFDIQAEPLDALDPAAAQSIALVVDLSSEQASVLQRMAVGFLTEPHNIPSRAALFLPGVPTDSPEFTHDRNALINTLNQTSNDTIETGSLDATLLSAIGAVARDADTDQRPAYVVLFTDDALAPGARSQALAQAQDAGVTIHAITASDSSNIDDIARLTSTTEGTLLTNPSEAEVSNLAQTIAQDQATHYRITFQSPTLADGQARDLTLQMGGEQAETVTLIPVIPGNASISPLLSLPTQLLVFGMTALLLVASALLPPMLIKRLKRPAGAQQEPLTNPSVASLSQPVEQVAVPLEGFSLQGAALSQKEVGGNAVGDLPDPSGGADAHVRPVTVPHYEPPPSETQTINGDRDNGAEPDPDLDSAAEPLPVDQAGSPDSVPTDDASHVAESGLPATPADYARIQTHTDFWGTLPNEAPSSPPAQETEQEVPTSSLQPPPLPIFHQPAASPSKQPRPPAENSAVREATHTDFWGPLPAVELEMPTDTATSDVAGLPADTGTSVDADIPSVADPAAPQLPELPLNGADHPTDLASAAHDQGIDDSEAPIMPPDDWDLLTPTETLLPPPSESGIEVTAERTTNASPAEAAGTHTDFWGPLADAEETTTNDIPAEPPIPSDRAEEPTNSAPQQADATVETHTDFWGPLPVTESENSPDEPNTSAAATEASPPPASPSSKDGAKVAE